MAIDNRIIAREVERARLWETTEGHCFYCREPVALALMHCDHKIPPSRGGSHDAYNRAPACGFCNTQKGQRTPEEYAEYLLSIGVLARFMDRDHKDRDWLLVMTPAGVARGRTSAHAGHPHMRVTA